MDREKSSNLNDKSSGERIPKDLAASAVKAGKFSARIILPQGFGGLVCKVYLRIVRSSFTLAIGQDLEPSGQPCRVDKE
jgi:hypothetical protein